MSSLTFFNFVKIGLREKIMPCLSVYERFLKLLPTFLSHQGILPFFETVN